jgi:hypothetical protein
VRPGRTADHSPPSSAEVLEEYPPLGHNRACNWVTLPYERKETVQIHHTILSVNSSILRVWVPSDISVQLHQDYVANIMLLTLAVLKICSS